MWLTILMVPTMVVGEVTLRRCVMANFSREEVIERIHDCLKSIDAERLEWFHNEICIEQIEYLGNWKFKSDDCDD